MGVVGDAFAQCPGLHGGGDLVCEGAVDGSPFVHDFFQAFVGFPGKVVLHLVQGQYVTAEQVGGIIGRCVLDRGVFG